MKTFLILILLLFLPHFVSAETITLKSGKTIEGKFIEVTGSYIKLEVNGIPVPYYFEELADKSDKGRLLDKYGNDVYAGSDDEALNKSMDRHAQRKVPEEIDLSNKAITVDQGSSRAYYNQLREEERGGVPAVSDEALNRTMGYHAQKKIPEGIDFSNKVFPMNPNSTSAYYNRLKNEERNSVHVASEEEILDKAMELHAHKRIPEEIDLLNRVIQLNPRSSRTYYRRAMAYYDLRRYYQAREDAYLAELEGERVSLAFIKELNSTYQPIDPLASQNSLKSALLNEGLTLEDFEFVTRHYYANPQSDKLASVVRAVTSQEWFTSDITLLAPFAHFVATVASKNRTLLLYFKNRLDIFSGGQREAMGKIIYETEHFRSPAPVSPQGIDYLWAEFFATGSPDTVKKIISALESPNAAKYSAEWSLRVNARQDEAVYKIIKKEKSCASGELKEYLTKILKK